MSVFPTVPHGVGRAATWLQAGLSRQQLRDLVAAGRLRQIRHGWYAAPHADADIMSAVRLGGRVGCLSALRLHRLWVPPHHGLHLRLPQRADRRRLPAGVHVCRPDGARSLGSGQSPVDPLAVALTAAGRCATPEQFVAILDSATHRLGIDRSELAGMLAGCPQRVRMLLDRCDRAESGTESLTRFRLTSRGIRVRPQVVIAGVGRVDLLVGRRLVIEVDSIAHHTSLEAYTRDRERDRRLMALGYLGVRLTYHQVMDEWDAVEPDLLAVIRRGDHRRSPKTAAAAVRRRHWSDDVA